MIYQFLNPGSAPKIGAIFLLAAIATFLVSRKLRNRGRLWLHRTSIAIAVLAVSIYLLGTVLYMPLVIFDDVVLSTWHDDIHIAGVAVDASTNHPVSNARVIVEASYAVLLAQRRYCFATITDANGKFAFTTKLPESCNLIVVSASSPTNLYAGIEWAENPIYLNLKPLVKDRGRRDSRRYSSFGAGIYRPPITFICKPWLFRHDDDEWRATEEPEDN